MVYLPAWSSLDARPVPAWFDEARFGIFIHFGLYSVPAYARRRREVGSTGEAYAEWYGSFVREPDGPVARFHEKHYGKDVRYEDFAARFRADRFDAGEWAALFRRAGARYTVLTAKHHDGYCLWPSAHSPRWNSVDVGPHRDIVGELAAAVRAEGLRPGLYYSLYEWYHPLYLRDPERYALEHMVPQMKELVSAYEPETLFTDGEWEHPSSVWHSEEFLAWLFNESAVRDRVAVNDRWGADSRSRHGGYFTTEYNEVSPGVELAAGRKWEENRGIGHSFGFNRNEPAEDYLTEGELVRLLVDTVSRGGNLCLNVGPDADGTIPALMQERLQQAGDWLRVNGEAVYGTGRLPFPAPAGGALRFTARNGRLYAFVLDWPEDGVVRLPAAAAAARRPSSPNRMLGRDGALPVASGPDGGLSVTLPYPAPGRLPCRCAWTLDLGELAGA